MGGWVGQWGQHGPAALPAAGKQGQPSMCSRPSTAQPQPTHLRAGVHRNTNVYMLPSNSDCMAPSSAILGSAVGAERWGKAGQSRVGMDMARVGRGPGASLYTGTRQAAPASTAQPQHTPSNHPPTAPDEGGCLAEALHRGAVLGRLPPVVLSPGGVNDDATHQQHHRGGVKGRHGAPGNSLHQRVGHQACREGAQGMAGQVRQGQRGEGPEGVRSTAFAASKR